MRADVSMKQGVQKRLRRGLRFLTIFLATAWLGSIPGFRSPLTAQSAAPAAVPRGKPIKPLAGQTQAVDPKVDSSKESVTTNTPAAKPGFASVGFDVLATFKYEVPEDAPASKTNAPAADPDTQIPAKVKAFSGKKVAVKGFILPLKVEGGLVTELLLMRDQSMCCFGIVPKINEWIAVKMTTSGIKPVMDQAVTLYGTLKVGAMRENGYLVGIYQMDADTIDRPPGS
ncbi:MAG: DUF3299 domain-containing protein [Pedosphaera sp.]|nr:DUF3299 domain-containing protein [Pedosphaera sp.]